jgi:hypothetical protein
MKALIVGVLVAGCLSGCGKVGITGALNGAVGNYAQVSLPAGCVAKQIAADEHGGVSVLCEDGRVFH